MKKQDNMTFAKVNNSTIMDSNVSEVDEISEKEFKRMDIRMINEIKKEMRGEGERKGY
jgi:hypothetical protein